MTIFKHELRMGRKSLAIWTASVSFFLLICILMFPQMRSQGDAIAALFSSMGAFSSAFGMDKLSFGTILGFYSVECGTMICLGGGFFAAMQGISALSKEEKNHTAEFLLTHPVKRSRIVAEKLFAVIVQILCMNLLLFAVSILSMAAVGEPIPMQELCLLHTAYFIMQLEIAGVCFGISAFLHRGSLGIGFGLASILYFMNIVANITDDAKFLKYLTPFGYTEAADIITAMKLDFGMIGIGASVTIVCVAASFWMYGRKDIR